VPLPPQLLAEIQAALGPAMVPNLTAASAGSDLFEGFILSLVLRAAAAEGAAITFENVDGTVTSTFTFRTSPGHIWWNTHPFTHAIVRFPNKRSLEAHTGIYIAGTSGVTHEADVVVLLRDEAETCRQRHAAPRYSKIILASECKFYSTTPGLYLGRGFLGLCSELSGRDCFFVTNTVAPSVERLLSHKKKKWDHQIVPGSGNDVTRLQNVFQDVFKVFKAKAA
jgi:hypothetical protein